MTAQNPHEPTPNGDLRATRDPFGRDALPPPPPLRIDGVQAPATLVLLDPGPEPRRGDRRGAARAWLTRLRALLPSRAGRCPDVGSLTDRQLADVGLARRDVEARPGWSGRGPAGPGASSPKGRFDRDRR